MTTDCPFCNIHTEKSRIIAEDGDAIVMLSNPRLVPGHLLVIPCRHIEKPWEIEYEELESIYAHVLEYQRIIVERFAPGCDVRQNYRPFIPQGRLKVNHVHWHLLPRWDKREDELYKKVMIHEAELFTDLTVNEMEHFAKLYSTTQPAEVLEEVD